MARTDYSRGCRHSLTSVRCGIATLSFRASAYPKKAHFWRIRTLNSGCLRNSASRSLLQFLLKTACGRYHWGTVLGNHASMNQLTLMRPFGRGTNQPFAQVLLENILAVVPWEQPLMAAGWGSNPVTVPATSGSSSDQAGPETTFGTARPARLCAVTFRLFSASSPCG